MTSALTSICSKCGRACAMRDHSNIADRTLAACQGGPAAWRDRPHFHAEGCACGHMWIEYTDTPRMTNTERRALDTIRDARRAGEA